MRLRYRIGSVVKSRGLIKVFGVCFTCLLLIKGAKWVYLYGIGGESTAVDFQWSVLKVILRGISPYWLFEQEGGFGKSFIMGQGPSYLQFIYVPLLPLGHLTLDVAKRIFVVLSAAIFVMGLVYICKGLRIEKTKAFVFVSVACGMPAFGYCLSNGQMSTIVFGCLAIGTYLNAGRISNLRNLSKSWAGGFIYGLSFCKWGYMPGLLVNAIFQQNFRFTIASVLPSILGVITFWNLTGSTSFKLLGPYLIIRKKWAWGFTDAAQTDVMSLLEAVFTWQEDIDNPLTIADGLLSYAPYIGVIVSTVLIGLISHRFRRRGITPWGALSICIMVLLVFIKHLPYDNMLLLVPLALSWSREVKRNSTRMTTTLCLSWFWLYPYFNSRMVTMIGVQASEITGISIGLCAITLSALSLLYDLTSETRISSGIEVAAK